MHSVVVSVKQTYLRIEGESWTGGVEELVRGPSIFVVCAYDICKRHGFSKLFSTRASIDRTEPGTWKTRTWDPRDFSGIPRDS